MLDFEHRKMSYVMSRGFLVRKVQCQVQVKERYCIQVSRVGYIYMFVTCAARKTRRGFYLQAGALTYVYMCVYLRCVCKCFIMCQPVSFACELTTEDRDQR